MPRPPALPSEEKASIVLSILSGQVTAAEAARQAGVSDQAISSWKRRFIEAGREGLDAGHGQQNTRELQLLKEISMLKSALGDSYLQLRELTSMRHHQRLAGKFTVG
ncbi:helix-turn-helix domain-containing protein [Kitasatospora sp. NPDC059722]|uniref:helix-turn-helix domain-containing protein n=1 Tax=Kitasatospora sp. NPDC059722 TaxID=3346925 RepID=UPI0036761E21